MISLDACILDNADPSLCSSQNNIREIYYSVLDENYSRI